MPKQTEIIEELRKRLQVMEDIEAIKQMKANYAYAVDKRDWDETMSYFTEDAEAVFGDSGSFTTKKAIEAHFHQAIAPSYSFFLHWCHNPVIKVNGNTASGTWYFNCPVVHMGEAKWVAGKYEDEYVKEAGQWKHKKMIISFAYFAAYKEGWTAPESGG